MVETEFFCLPSMFEFDCKGELVSQRGLKGVVGSGDGFGEVSVIGAYNRILDSVGQEFVVRRLRLKMNGWPLRVCLDEGCDVG